jgi:hypothetical protein
MSASTEILNIRLTSEGGPVKLSRVFLALLAYKIVYLLAVSAAISIWPKKANADMYHSHRQVSTPDGYLTFDCHFAIWDAEHYLFIAAHGYESGTSRCAFYPLFPLTIKYFSMISGGSQLVAGMILANVFSLAGWFIFFTVVCRGFGESVAKLAVILLIAFPGSLFFQFVYTESLFFLLLMLLLLGLQENRFWLALTAAFLLPLTRAVGLFCIFPLIWHVMTNSQPAWRGKLKRQMLWGRRHHATAEAAQAASSPAPPISTNQPRQGGGWLLLAPFCGWAFYLLLMKKWTGNAFEGFEAQKQFHIQSIGNVFDVSHFVSTLITPAHFHEVFGSGLDRCSFILLICTLPSIMRLDEGWLLWSLLLGVVPAMSGMFVSYTRFASVVFPLFVAIAAFLNKPGVLLRCLRLVTVATFAIFQMILVWRFVNYRWAG